MVVVVEGDEGEIGTSRGDHEIAHEDGVLGDRVEALGLSTELTDLREGARYVG